jgi:hypothetical protein
MLRAVEAQRRCWLDDQVHIERASKPPRQQ